MAGCRRCQMPGMHQTGGGKQQRSGRHRCDRTKGTEGSHPVTVGGRRAARGPAGNA
ncbi:hypothetical protein BJY27_007961 [Streptomyces rapamycinicus]|uniref:Uncharacterized protein n=1 Tax=Streptomyces rapamycinicus TaxID=1226757 RepID=A0ABR6LXD4_9ACTN|nr:hypothetical protein [Streptomyces rapamycinicus]